MAKNLTLTVIEAARLFQNRAGGVERVQKTSALVGQEDGSWQFQIEDRSGGILLVRVSQYKDPPG